VVTERSEERESRSGGTLIYRILTIRFAVVSGVDGSSFSGVVVGEGMDSGDKAANKAMAVGLKYFLCQSLCLPYDEIDPDGESHEVKGKTTTPKPQQEHAPAAPKAPPAQTHDAGEMMLIGKLVNIVEQVSKKTKRVYWDLVLGEDNGQEHKVSTPKKEEADKACVLCGERVCITYKTAGDKGQFKNLVEISPVRSGTTASASKDDLPF
jgi:hypothetical protein